tara:strand:+ start:9470 stop:10855 length:1386 start_codon:yes stop_codon:yes gene_type:complete
MKKKNKKIYIHFVGIGGIGMSGIAELMYNLGYKVVGTDINESEIISRLKKIGIKVLIGHQRKNLDDVDAVVYSSAIKKNNPEILEAKDRKIPLLSRADMLGELMKNKKSIAVAGSHGKTTTTSLIGNILEEGKFDPTIVNGGIINSFSKNNKYGRGKWMVVEADESDGSFLKLPHQVSIICNLDLEHMDFYKTKKNLLESFEKFITNLPFYGVSIINEDDKNLKKIISKINTRKIITFSIKNKNADVLINKISYNKNVSGFTLNFNKKINYITKPQKYFIKAIGLHNVLNGAASVIAGIQVGVQNEKIKKALKNYIGVKRRFTYLGKINSSKIYDDYAHHPTEIAATLSGARQIGKKIIVIFQPHRYSRTKILFKEFVKVLTKINQLYLIDTYSAGEKKIIGADSKDLFRKLNKLKKNVEYLDKKNFNNTILKQTNEKNIIIFMGAGSISKMAYNFMNINE